MKWYMYIYQSPTKTFENAVYSNQEGGPGHGPLCPLAMPVTVVQPGFVNGGQREGAK